MSVRSERINGEIQKYLAVIIQNACLESFKGVMIGVVSALVSKDLKLCTVAISIYPKQNKKEIFEFIKERNVVFRKQLASELRHLRTVPELRFVLDESLDRSEKINAILREINKD